MGEEVRTPAGNLDTVGWKPKSVPQAAFIACPVFEIFYGGSRGSLKTDGALGDWIRHSANYGEDAIGLMVRRNRTQLTETYERAKQIYVPLGFKFNEQDHTCKSPTGARLRFAYLERDSDAEEYQGHSYCAEISTQIQMADGSLKTIGEIKPGEMVRTLEGPRRVNATVKPYLAPCVSALVQDERGELVGRQVHPIWHPVLTSVGVSELRKPYLPQNGDQCHSDSLFPHKQDGLFPHEKDQECRAWAAFVEDGRSDYTKSLDSLLKISQLPPLSVPVTLCLPSHRQEALRTHVAHKVSKLFDGFCKFVVQQLRSPQHPQWPSSDRERVISLSLLSLGRFFLCQPNALSCVENGFPLETNYPNGCRPANDFYDGRALFLRENDLTRLPLQGDAGATHHELPLGELGTIPKYTRQAQRSWVHPYSGEERHLVEPVRTGMMELRWHGFAWVTDLCVEDANHYISECGIVNKNTRVYIEEIGNFPSPSPIMKLMATLRSARGVPVGFRATGNPGGPGQHWVKERYIDPNPRGWHVIKAEFTNPFNGEKLIRERVFIPGKITDHDLLGAAYIANLQMSGSPELVRAWLEGDWNVVAGAFFSEFSMDRHVVAPFAIPEHWTRIRSMDWGSARPFSVGWYAVSDGSMPGIARGAMVKYREWYGMKAGHYNVGLKLIAEEVALGISRAEDEHIHDAVIDPSAFSQDGGPSIAERMPKCNWRPADNRRISRYGALGGWDQLRSRLKGTEEGPLIVFFSTCIHTIRTIPALQHDEMKPEDVDTEGEDHAADETRYACMSRPILHDAPDKPDPKFPMDRTFNEIIEHMKRKRISREEA